MILQLQVINAGLLKNPGFLHVGKSYRLGRNKFQCDFVVDDASISRVHAEVQAKDNSVVVTDLQSLNGVQVNGKKVASAEIQAGEFFVLGIAQFQLKGHELSELVEESTIASNRRPDNAISAAEQRVLYFLLMGNSDKEIASKLDKSANTVHAQVQKIFEKYRVSSRAELMALFLSESKVRRIRNP